MKNLENIKKVLDIIEQHPETWNQRLWHCGTAHCFAGHAQLLLTGKEDNINARREARIFFGFNNQEANYYFNENRTLAELKTALLNFYDPNGFGRDGYNLEGYNPMGYNRNGYNHQGYDRSGFDSSGYDREGYNRKGYDRDGLDRNNSPELALPLV